VKCPPPLSYIFYSGHGIYLQILKTNLQILANFISTGVKNILQIFQSVLQIVTINLQKDGTSLKTLRQSQGATRIWHPK